MSDKRTHIDFMLNDKDSMESLIIDFLNTIPKGEKSKFIKKCLILGITSYIQSFEKK